VSATEWVPVVDTPSFSLCGHSGPVLALTGGTTNTNIVVSGSRDFTARLWDIETGQCTGLLEGHVAAVRDVAFSPVRGTFLT
jgi:WD40 repeat protein